MRCEIDECHGRVEGRKRYCSPKCKDKAHRAVKKRYKLTQTVMGKRLAYLLDCERARETPMTIKTWREEHNAEIRI